MKNYILLLLALILVSINPVFSQEESKEEPKKVVVVTHDGAERVGIIISDDGREVLLDTEAMGKIYIYKSDIKSITPLDEVDYQIVNGDFRSSGPFTTRYAFTTNALSIKKNENYAKLTLSGPEVHFALSDRFSLGIMTSWIAAPIALAAKYTIPTNNEKLNFGVGTIIGTSGYLGQFKGFGGLHWGMVTIGDRMKNLTFSAGFLYGGFADKRNVPQIGTHYAVDNDWGGKDHSIPTEQVRRPLFTAPTISVAGIAKVGVKASFVFDSMIFFGSQKSIQRQTEYINDPMTGIASYAIVSEGSSETQKGSLILLMPGMRFQKNEDRAFQVNIAGGTFVQNGNSFSAAFPMFSWFFKF